MAIFIDRHAITAQSRQPYAADLVRLDARALDKLARQPAKITPPNRFCIVLIPTILRVLGLMLTRCLRHNLTLRIY